MNFDLIVIGSGPGGYVAAIRAAQLGLKTACVEKGALGGVCLNVGCIPSKTLLHATESYYHLTHGGKELGIEVDGVRFNFPQLMQRKAGVIKGFNEGIAGLFKKNKIAHIAGTAQFVSPTEIMVGGERYTSKYFIIATGSEPIPLPFLPFDERRVLSSTGALSLEKVPEKMVVVGAGIIGVELGSVYSRLGTHVTFVEMATTICPTLDGTLSKQLQDALTKQGMEFHLGAKVIQGQIGKGVTLGVTTADQKNISIEADVALVSIGRRSYTQGLGLETIGIVPNSRGMIPVNGQFRTAQPHIFAIGDVVDGPMLAHKASEEGVAAAEIIAGLTPRINYLAIPSVVYTSPEVASVGLTEQDAKQQGLSCKIGTFPFKANSRAKCTAEDFGLVKIIADEKTDIIVGVHIIGAHASELIAEGALALEKRITATELAATPHAHPTLSEAIKEAALDVSKRALHK
jgi:dihydrolipoamide dehydrogenase